MLPLESLKQTLETHYHRGGIEETDQLEIKSRSPAENREIIITSNHWKTGVNAVALVSRF